MFTSNSISTLLLFLFFESLCTPVRSYSQDPKLKSTSWRDNWKIDVKTGIGALLSEVPEKYLNRINNVNIPVKVPGTTSILTVRKGLTPHFEMGYQFDYMRIQGIVKLEESSYNVLTQAFGSSFLVLYNLIRTDDYRPRFNYFGYYKIGAVSLKNNPGEIKQETDLKHVSVSQDGNEFVKNVAIITGIGIGVNYQMNNNLSMVGTVDINRSSDAVAEIYKIHKILYHSSNTVNNYSSLTLGLCYTFNFSEQKKSSYFDSRTETEKKLIQSKIRRKKGKSSKANLPGWYNLKSGK